MLKYSEILSVKGTWINPLDTTRGCHSLTEEERVILSIGLKFINSFRFKVQPKLRITNPNNINYAEKKNRLQIPIPERFKTIEYYFMSLFHEYGHATGYKNRLNRNSLTYYWQIESAHRLEEVTAELIALKLGQKFKLHYDWMNCYRYIMTFLIKVNEERRKNILIEANQQADKAVKYLLSGD